MWLNINQVNPFSFSFFFFFSFFSSLFSPLSTMGNANSRPSEEVLATLSSKSRKKYNQSYPNFFESKSTASDRHSPRGSIISIRKDKRKHSSASEDSSLLNAAVSLLSSSPPSPLNTTPEYTIPIEYEIRNGRRYMISPAHRFYLPCDDEEADRIVILVSIFHDSQQQRLYSPPFGSSISASNTPSMAMLWLQWFNRFV